MKHDFLDPIEPGGQYIRERNIGDMKADRYRKAFLLSVCEAAHTSFCSVKKFKDETSCHTALKKCDAPLITINTRFISKYGVASTSANRDGLHPSNWTSLWRVNIIG